MALTTLTVRRARRKFDRSGKNFSSESQVYNDSNIKRAIPSVCKKDGISDGLVNAKVTVADEGEENVLYLWVTQDVSAIASLT